ncbi:MAG: glycosyltransferase family 2 protein [Sulfuricella sp.]|nr:glycosyltransferase family 2 protein [Sulfuricella sp.]
MLTKIFSIVVPVYQNAGNLPFTMPTLLAMQKQLPEWKLELVFVDDGSTDGSYKLLAEFALDNPEQVKVVKLTRNFGQNPAIQAGLLYATGDCVGIVSADLQEPCEYFLDMLKEWKLGAKFVIGERVVREENWWHRNISGFYWRLIRRAAFPELPEMGYDFCLLDRQVVENINHIREKNSPIFILLYWLGYKPVRLPIIRKKREVGRSQWRLIKKIQLAIDTLIGFTYLPSRLITLMSFSASFFALVYLLFLLYRWHSTGAAPLGWMTVVGLLVLFGALILFALGIISEYLLRILDESRKRPPFVVDAVMGSLEGGQHRR